MGFMQFSGFACDKCGSSGIEANGTDPKVILRTLALLTGANGVGDQDAEGEGSNQDEALLRTNRRVASVLSIQ